MTFNGTTNRLYKYHWSLSSTSGVYFTKIRRVYNASQPAPCLTWASDLKIRFVGDQLQFAFGSTSFTSTSTNIGSMDGEWHTLLITWADSLDPAVSSDTFQVYWDDVPLATNTPYINTVNFMGDAPIGACSSSGSNPYTGDIDSYFYEKNQFLDLSVETNRRKFYNADGTLKDIGADGSGVFSTPAMMYFRGNASEWTSKAGTEGWTVNGTLSDAP